MLQSRHVNQENLNLFRGPIQLPYDGTLRQVCGEPRSESELDDLNLENAIQIVDSRLDSHSDSKIFRTV
jgi:hypothetical protein